MNYSFIETHCHLDYLKAFPLGEILEKAKAASIEKMMTISVEPSNFQTVMDLTQKHANVYGTQGVHPHDSKAIEDIHYEEIKKNARANNKIVAIGEIGLDYHYNNSPTEIQKESFEKQLEIAVELNLPVVIHSRDADEDTISILKNVSSRLKRKGVIHSFTSGKGLAEFALNEGFCLGFNGIITFPKADNVREIVAMTPPENILFETDSPFLTPVPHRGKENGPYFLPFVAHKLAELKGLSPEVLFPQVYQNSVKLFGFRDISFLK